MYVHYIRKRIIAVKELQGSYLIPVSYTHLFSDIPGCGIGALDHVYLQLAEREGDEFELMPVSYTHLDEVLVAIGRTLNTRGMGLEEVGVKMEKNGQIVTDLSLIHILR